MVIRSGGDFTEEWRSIGEYQMNWKKFTQYSTLYSSLKEWIENRWGSAHSVHYVHSVHAREQKWLSCFKHNARESPQKLRLDVWFWGVVWMKAREWESDGWGMGRRRSCVRQCQRLLARRDGWGSSLDSTSLPHPTNNSHKSRNSTQHSLWITLEILFQTVSAILGKKKQMEVCETCCVCVDWEEDLLDMIDRAIPKMFWGHSICQRLKQEAIDGEAGQYECARVFACQE